MTDKDRYGKSLGKKWARKVGSALRAVDPEAALAPEAMAQYVHAELRKHIPLADLLAEVRSFADDQPLLFGSEEAKERFERRLRGTLGGDQLLRCIERGANHGWTYSKILRAFAETSIASTREVLVSQRGYKDDAALHDSFDKQALKATRLLHGMMLRDGGAPAPDISVRTTSSTTDLIEFPVVRKK